MKKIQTVLAALCVAALVGLGGCASSANQRTATYGWETLVDGEYGLANFRKVGDANWRVQDGVIVADKGGKEASYLVTRTSYTDFIIYAEFWVNDDYLGMFAKQRQKHPLDFPTGAKYDYNNTNFMLLALIVERVGKRSFGKFLRDEIFHPVGMEHSFVYESPKAVPDNPPGYTNAVAYEWRKKKSVWEAAWGAPPARHEELLAVGDGAVWTNLEDMHKWDIAVRAEKLLKPATWKLALTPSKTRDGKTNDYGLGWGLYYDKPSELYGYGHDGSWEGFQTTYYRYLTTDRTTVLLSNRGNINTDKLWTALDGLVEKHLAKK